MSESEKPFACPSPGCTMSFVNEDHLMVHRKKHDMILNLGSNGKANVFVADQTPTPTRFIRNCEEVGLFQDLQNVNPFEETFRRAVEAGKTGALAVPEVGISDDTLHTPHIFPHIVNAPPVDNQDLLQSVASEPPVVSITDSSDDDAKHSQRSCANGINERQNSEEIKTVELDTDSQDGSIVETIVVQEADTSISTTVVNLNNNFHRKTTPQLSINGKEVQLLMKTENGKLMHLSAIPVSHAQLNPTTVNIQSNTQTVVIKTEPSLHYSEKQRTAKSASSRLSLAKMKLKQVLTKNSASPEVQEEIETRSASIAVKDDHSNNNQVVDVTRKQDMLERNRASSMRARAKRKAWIQQLERSVDNANEANAVLQLEVRALRSEVAKLKTLLLAHKDCPVTKAMEQGNSIILGPKVISLGTDVLQSTSLTTPVTAIKRTSVTSTEVEALPKKKPSVSTPTNPMILPKSSTGPSPMIQKAKIVRNISAIKIVDVEHVLAKREKGKQILIVHNHNRKESENPRQIIRINPNFELENAASKSTGS